MKKFGGPILPIDRYALITRHNPSYTGLEKDAPLSVGNGAFCFTADFTGLQTFSGEYAAPSDGFPLCTMAEWGWHSYPGAPKDESLLRFDPFDTWGRQVPYAVDETGQEELFKALRQNAHKFHLGKIGFDLAGAALSFDNTKPIAQRLNLWEGVLYSEFTVEGFPARTETFVHPGEDTVYVRVHSPLLKEGRLRVVLEFPYGSHRKSSANFAAPQSHSTTVTGRDAGGLVLDRLMDGVEYRVTLAWQPGADPALYTDRHKIALAGRADTLELAFRFKPCRVPAAGIDAPADKTAPPPFSPARAVCAAFWEAYWTAGGAMDFSGSTDSRAAELERRIVLSRYLTAIQSRGRLPPAETGLTCNSWYGKFHLEMFYWHSAHFALWGQVEELKRSLAYYKKILPVARKIAAVQGYKGARWPKMCDPTGYNTPSSVAVLLIWQQPHPVMLAELCYRSAPDKDFLREYRDVIVETAEFMASFVHREEPPGEGSYVLGPPYIPAQERHDPRTVLNAAYELEYFRWSLRRADVWLERLGEAPRFGTIAEKLPPPARKDGVYLAHENCPDTFTKLPFYTDHPSMLAMYGILDSEKVDPALMSATLDRVKAVWDMRTFYGWDFPMMAMTACRLGRFDEAADLLLMDSPKNTYLLNGHNRQTGDEALPLYLPGNGGLLIAAAMMAAGFGNKTGSSFPGGFTVKTENIYAYL
jgi:hypothetical protein